MPWLNLIHDFHFRFDGESLDTEGVSFEYVKSKQHKLSNTSKAKISPSWQRGFILLVGRCCRHLNQIRMVFSDARDRTLRKDCAVLKKIIITFN